MWLLQSTGLYSFKILCGTGMNSTFQLIKIITGCLDNLIGYTTEMQ